MNEMKMFYYARIARNNRLSAGLIIFEVLLNVIQSGMEMSQRICLGLFAARDGSRIL